MKINLYIILLILTALSVMSCKSNFKFRVYYFVPEITPAAVHNPSEMTRILSESDRKSIILKNDSVLGYFVMYGGLGGLRLINYKIVNSELITDSLNHDGYSVPNMTSTTFSYSKDSLTNKKTNEKYYVRKYCKAMKY